MKKNLLISGALIGALLLSVPFVSSAFNQGGYLGGNMMNGSTGQQGMLVQGGMGQGMMLNGNMGHGMMMHSNMIGSGGVPLAEPVDSEKAKELVNNYLKSSGMSNVSLAEIMEFDTHFYIETREIENGKYAEELILDKSTGSLSPEMGPNMMWNVKYGHMGGMMSNPGNNAKTMVSSEDAVKLANAFLKDAKSNETAAEPHEFYGYYTLHTLEEGKIVGMLSVNSYTGQVWYHTWHGNYVGMESSGEPDHAHGEHN